MTNNLTAERLRELVAGATPGPWRHYDEVFRRQFGKRRVTEIQQHRSGKAVVNWQGFDGDQARKGNANAALIVTLVNAAPQIIALMEREARMKEALAEVILCRRCLACSYTASAGLTKETKP